MGFTQQLCQRDRLSHGVAASYNASEGDKTQNSESERGSHKWAGGGQWTLQETGLLESETAPRLLIMTKCVYRTSVHVSVEGEGCRRGGEARPSFPI